MKQFILSITSKHFNHFTRKKFNLYYLLKVNHIFDAFYDSGKFHSLAILTPAKTHGNQELLEDFKVP